MIKHLLLVFFVLIGVIGVLALQMGGEGTINGQAIANYGDPAPALDSVHEPLDMLIFGGTSGIGFEATKLALARGHRVTSITRRPERMAIAHENLLNLKGDIADRSSFDHLLVAKDAVISSVA